LNLVLTGFNKLRVTSEGNTFILDQK